MRKPLAVWHLIITFSDSVMDFLYNIPNRIRIPLLDHKLHQIERRTTHLQITPHESTNEEKTCVNLIQRDDLNKEVDIVIEMVRLKISIAERRANRMKKKDTISA